MIAVPQVRILSHPLRGSRIMVITPASQAGNAGPIPVYRSQNNRAMALRGHGNAPHHSEGAAFPYALSTPYAMPTTCGHMRTSVHMVCNVRIVYGCSPCAQGLRLCSRAYSCSRDTPMG